MSPGGYILEEGRKASRGGHGPAQPRPTWRVEGREGGLPLLSLWRPLRALGSRMSWEVDNQVQGLLALGDRAGPCLNLPPSPPPQPPSILLWPEVWEPRKPALKDGLVNRSVWG